MTRDLEERVRSALTARAEQITPSSLQPAAPPTTLGNPRRDLLRWWTVVATLACTLGVGLVFLVMLLVPGGPSSDPTLPASSVPPEPSPSLTTPAPQPSSGGPAPSPSRPAGDAEGPAATPRATLRRSPPASGEVRPSRTPAAPDGERPAPLPTATGG
jgi:hypothetical protein